MRNREALAVAVAVLCAVGVVAPAVTAAQTATPTTETANGTDAESAPVGTQMTAFMQSSAAEANDTVESGMWAAGFERANESERARLAGERTDALEGRLERLRERNETLAERYENGSVNETTYLVASSRLAGRMAALRTSVDDTERVANGSVNRTRLDRLRTEAHTMTGPEVAGVARGLVAGGQGPRAGQGPPAGPGVGSADQSNGNQAGPANGTQVGPATERPGGSAGEGNADPVIDASDSGSAGNAGDSGGVLADRTPADEPANATDRSIGVTTSTDVTTSQ